MKKLMMVMVLLVLSIASYGTARKINKPVKAEIVILLDHSGSMEDMEDEMEKAIKKFIKRQKRLDAQISCTLITFDDRYEVQYTQRPIAEVGPVDIQPRGRTALLDALGKSLIDTAIQCRASKVIFVVITDGLENASTQFNRAGICASIDYLQDQYKWEFVYLGANQDSLREAQTYGIDTTWDFDLTSMDTVVDCAATFVTNYIGDANNIID